MNRLLAAALAAGLVAGSALAQPAVDQPADAQSANPQPTPPGTPETQSGPAASSDPKPAAAPSPDAKPAAASQPVGAAEPAGSAATADDQKAVNQALAVSQVKLTSGQRASRVIGASVYTEAGEKVGSVDDVILSPDAKATLATLQVGGLLGVGGKLVAVPFDRLQMAPDGKVTLSGGSKDSLEAQPAFTY